MTDDRAKRLAQLRQAFERGILDEDTYRAAVAGLEAEAGAAATQTGAGGLAQDGSVAAGAEGVAVGRDVRGDVLAPGARKEVHHHAPQGADLTPLRQAYLHRVFETAAHLSLAGVDPKAASGEAEARLNLGAVYTALLTLTAEGHERDLERQRLSAVDQLDRHARLVLLGDPGSGKSTFVNFVALCLAGEALGREDANLALLTAPLPSDEDEARRRREEAEPKPQPWRHGPLLPVRIVLRDFAARGLPPPGERATAGHLRRFLVAELQAAALGAYADPLARELLEKGGLLLLDGLDEVPEADRRREQIRQAVQDFCATFGRCRLLVTSRTYAYQQQDWRLPGFAEAVLAPFTTGQIQRFVDRWYAHIAALRGLHADDAQGRAELLKRAIVGSERLHALAERPLLLTLMASLHAWRGGSLPEKREELYADTVDLLLDWWESPKTVRDAQGQVVVLQPSLAEWLKVDRDRVRNLLEELAYQAHAAQRDTSAELGAGPVGTADVPEGDLVCGLMQLSQNPDVNPVRLVEYLSQRAGLLLPRGVGVYTFPHRTFQEYLAACHLTDHDYPDLVADLARQGPGRWREVALLAGAKAARGTASAVWSLVEALCYRDVGQDGILPNADAWGALLAGQALVESGAVAGVSERYRPKVERVCSHLVRILEAGRLPAVERAAAGRALAVLGDPRPGVGVIPSPVSRGRAGEGVLPDILWCQVPAGPFLMGSADEDEMASNDEKPQHEQTIPAPYGIGKYPVTVAQYACFVQAGGYGERRFWTAAGWAWREKEGVAGPPDYGEPYNLANQPAVGVRWYEAVAFCRWLTEALREAGELSEGQTVMLPSEAEWEKAARGADGRIFPWGNEFDADRCNMTDTGIGGTSAVGCFPGGKSPYGVEELSGNVWEWTRSVWGKDWEKPDFEYSYKAEDGRENLELDGTYLRVMRGGSFDDPRLLARCVCRYRGPPDLVWLILGFRVVVSPISPTSAL
ncbi:MAG: formylglycine-generating enzyme family protein [Chloroflexota bacterium]